MNKLTEHYDIKNTLHYGYAGPRKREFCMDCGEAPAAVADDGGRRLCCECALKDWQRMSEDEQLELLGFGEI